MMGSHLNTKILRELNAAGQIDAFQVEQLINEVERLSNKCPKCGYQFLYKSGLDRHPCPPPPDYNFGAP